MKTFREETAKGNGKEATKALNAAKAGYYSADVDDKSEESIPAEPTELDCRWYFDGIKDFGFELSTMIESAGELQRVGASQAKPIEVKPADAQPGLLPGAVVPSAYRNLMLGDVRLTHIPGSKVNIDHADRRAAYKFDKRRAESLDDDFLSPDGLSIPSLGLTIKDLGKDVVRIRIRGSGLHVDLYKDATAADIE
jgi:hypothetical protein